MVKNNHFYINHECHLTPRRNLHCARQQQKPYNLDAIISVGYRIRSRRATQFRQWATRSLKQHLADDYIVLK